MQAGAGAGAAGGEGSGGGRPAQAGGTISGEDRIPSPHPVLLLSWQGLDPGAPTPLSLQGVCHTKVLALQFPPARGGGAACKAGGRNFAHWFAERVGGITGVGGGK